MFGIIYVTPHVYLHFCETFRNSEAARVRNSNTKPISEESVHQIFLKIFIDFGLWGMKFCCFQRALLREKNSQLKGCCHVLKLLWTIPPWSFFFLF